MITFANRAGKMRIDLLEQLDDYLGSCIFSPSIGLHWKIIFIREEGKGEGEGGQEDCEVYIWLGSHRYPVPTNFYTLL